MLNGDTPKLKVLNRIFISKATIAKDAALKTIAADYVKKTAEFGNMLKAVKLASAALKTALAPKLTSQGIDEGTDWKVTEGDDGGLIVEVIERHKPAGSRSRIPTTTL